MTIVVDDTPKADIQTLLDMEGDPATVLLIGKHPHNPDKFELGTSIAGSNTDISPSGLPVYIIPADDKAGTYRLNVTDGIVSLTEES